MSSSRVKRFKKKAEKKEVLNRVELPVDAKDLLGEVEGIDIDEVDEEAEAAEIAQKDIDIYQPTFGATSFEQLDEARSAYEQTQQTRLNANDLQSIISNIFYDDSIEDKAKAIADATDQFRQRMVSMPQKKSNPVLDLIQGIKAKLTSGSINDLPDSAFAYIEPGGKKDAGGKTTPRSLRHFPVHDAAHARNALARAAQSPFGAKAMPKIRAAAKKFGIKVSGKESNLRIYKDKDGDWRWLGVFSNNFKDTSDEIITEAAHKEFISHLDAHPETAPLFVPWHTLSAARKNRADFWDYVDGFVLIGGKLEEKEAVALQKAQKETQLGMSHGFFVLEHDSKDKNLITKYRSFEVSDLPLERAANPFTGINLIMKEVAMGFDKKKREYLVSQIGEDAVTGIEKELKQGGNILQLLGVPSKEAEPSDTEDTELGEDATEEAEVSTEEQPEMEAVATIAKAVGKELGMDQLSETLAGMDKTIKEQGALIEKQNKQIAKLQKSKDEEIAETIAPKSSLFWLSKQRPSQSKSTEITKEEVEEEATEAQEKEKPDAWLETALKVQVQ